MIDKNRLTLTKAYQCFKKYHDGFYSKSNIEAVLKEARNFYAGKQYESVVSDMPQPILNICKECVDKTTAKILETPTKISFIADVDNTNLNSLDNFYDYQKKQIDDSETDYLVVRAGCIDGIGIAFTTFDEDTIGIESPFRGFLKRQVIPFEQTFWENPYTSDEQDQQYIGYYYAMEISALKSLLEGSKEDIEEKKKLILPEDYFEIDKGYTDYDTSDIDNKVVNVYVRMFRKDGEVAFEMSTKYVDIFEHPHFLNPSKNEEILIEMQKDFLKKLNNDEQEDEKDVIDYEMDAAKYTLYTKAKKSTKSEYLKSKSKFYRYPVSVFVPRPITKSIIGESLIANVIPNQKIINYNFLLMILIEQSHAMPKILVKPNALNGQEYDNSPNQVIEDNTPVTNGVQWGITRLSSGDAVNNSLIEMGNGMISLTRQINGFDDVMANLAPDASGYLYQQAVQQANITLQQPQKRYWHYLKNNARNDLMYFRHYITKAKYYIERSDSEVEMQNRYRDMSENVLQSKQIGDIPQGTTLPMANKVYVNEIDNTMFDRDFNVTVEIEQGVASSVVSESQHFQQIFQYIVSGNADYDKIKLMVQNDPAFSAKLRQSIMNTIEELEISQVQMLKSENNELKAMVQQLANNFKQAQYSIDYLKQRDVARNKAFDQSIKQNQAAVQAFANGMQQQQTESEVKSKNAKGISGGSFSSPND